MINKAILVGNTCADPEVRTTGSGTAVCNLRIATNSRRKNAAGDWEDAAEFHSVTTFGKLAENCGRYLQKGRQVYVEGRLQTRKWEDRDGNTRYTTEVVANEVKFLGSKGDDRGGRQDDRGSGGYGGGSGGSRTDEEPPF